MGKVSITEQKTKNKDGFCEFRTAREVGSHTRLDGAGGIGPFLPFPHTGLTIVGVIREARCGSSVESIGKLGWLAGCTAVLAGRDDFLLLQTVRDRGHSLSTCNSCGILCFARVVVIAALR